MKTKSQKTHQTLVSIAIPTYNHADYLSKAIDSVLSQDFSDYEIVIVNNASTDNTDEIVQKYSGLAQIRYVRSTEHVDVVTNWNKALSESSGKYISFLSSDDYFYPGHILKMVKLLEENSDCHLAYCPCYWVDENGHSAQLAIHPGHRKYSYAGGRNELAELLVYDSYITPSAAFIRRESVVKAGGFDTHVVRGSDWDMWVRLAQINQNFVFSNQATVAYRVHPSQTWHFHSLDPLRDHILILEKVIATSGRNAQFKGYELQILRYLERRTTGYRPEEIETFRSRLVSLGHFLSKESIALSTSTPRPLPKKQNLPVENPVVSIIVPTFNRPFQLKRALESIARQSFSNYEVIIVNDAGDDVSAIIDGFQNRLTIQYVVNEKNQGAGASRNLAIKLAKGKYIAFLDDDDIFYPGHLETLVNELERDPNICAAYSDAVQVTTDAGSDKTTIMDRRLVYSEEFSFPRLLAMNYIPMLCLMTRRASLEKAGLFNCDLPALEDWEWLIRLSKQGSFGHIPMTTAEYTVKNDIRSRNKLLPGEIQSLYIKIYRMHNIQNIPEALTLRSKVYESMTQRSLKEDAPDLFPDTPPVFEQTERGPRPSAEEFFDKLLNAEDIEAFLLENKMYVDEKLLHLVKGLIQSTAENEDKDIIEGLTILQADIEEIILDRQV